jgi:membrane protein DedA with SNARE-associated domain
MPDSDLTESWLQFPGAPAWRDLCERRPVLLAAGALVGFHCLSLAPVLALAAAASLICDSLWFSLGRRRGGAVPKFVCRVSIEP